MDLDIAPALGSQIAQKVAVVASRFLILSTSIRFY